MIIYIYIYSIFQFLFIYKVKILANEMRINKMVQRE
jgi:hypothetical protein